MFPPRVIRHPAGIHSSAPPRQNGVAESFMGTLKLECIWRQRFDTYDAAKAAITA
jgi:hypothetical protein